MKRILIDTNVILDLLAEREPYFKDGQQIFSRADREEFILVVSSLSLVNTHYILSQHLKDKGARSTVWKLKVLVSTHELNDKIIELTLNDGGFKDFEDGIQYYTALESQCDMIITRNLKDFKSADIPVLTPRQFIAKLDTEK